MLRQLLHTLGRSGRRALVSLLILTLLGSPTLVPLRPAWAAFVEAPPTQMPATAEATHGLVVGDVNGDGAPDVVVLNAGQSRLFLNAGHGTFTDVTATHLPALTLSTLGVALGDVDGDGDLDLVLANRGGQSWLWLNDGHGHFVDIVVTDRGADDRMDYRGQVF